MSTAAHLPPLLANIAPLLDRYGYLAIGGLLLLENIGIPVVPGESALIAGAIYAGVPGPRHLNVVVVGAVAVLACFLGSGIGYAIGYFGGRRLVERYGRYVFVKPHHLDRAERAVSRHGGAVVVAARFIVGLRELNGIIAGVTGMRWPRFATYNAAGAVAWVTVWLTAGYAAGDNITGIYGAITRYALYVVAVVVVAGAALIARAMLRRRAGTGG